MHVDFRQPSGGLRGGPGGLVVSEELGLALARQVFGPRGPSGPAANEVSAAIFRQVFGAKVAAAAAPSGGGGGGGASPLTTKGDVYTHSTVDARLPVGTDGYVLTADSTQATGLGWQPTGGGGGTPVPATINDLVFWYKTDPFSGSAGASTPFIVNRTPAYTGVGTQVASGSSVGVISAAQLNGLNTIDLVGGESYVSAQGILLHKSTVFAVAKPTNLSGGGGFGPDLYCGSAPNCLEVRIEPTGKFLLVQRGTAAIGGSASAAFVLNTWAQVNCTYDDASGAYSFRSSQANIGSGTNVKTISGTNTTLLQFGGGSTLDWVGSFAELIVYNRVLTLTEIGTVETYLNTKWGV